MVIIPLRLRHKTYNHGLFTYFPECKESLSLFENKCTVKHETFIEYSFLNKLFAFHCKDLGVKYSNYYLEITGNKVSRKLASILSIMVIGATLSERSIFDKHRGGLQILQSCTRGVGVHITPHLLEQRFFELYEAVLYNLFYKYLTLEELNELTLGNLEILEVVGPGNPGPNDEGQDDGADMDSAEGQNGSAEGSTAPESGIDDENSNDSDSTLRSPSPVDSLILAKVNFAKKKTKGAVKFFEREETRSDSDPEPPKACNSTPSVSRNRTLNQRLRQAHTIERAIRFCLIEGNGEKPWEILEREIEADPSLVVVWGKRQRDEEKFCFFHNRGNYGSFKKLCANICVGVPLPLLKAAPRRKKKEPVENYCRGNQCQQNRVEMAQPNPLNFNNLQVNQDIQPMPEQVPGYPLVPAYQLPAAADNYNQPQQGYFTSNYEPAYYYNNNNNYQY